MLAFVVLMAAHGRFRGAHCAVLGAHGRVLGARGRVLPAHGRVRRAPIARAAPPFGIFGDLQHFFRIHLGCDSLSTFSATFMKTQARVQQLFYPLSVYIPPSLGDFDLFGEKC